MTIRARTLATGLALLIAAGAAFAQRGETVRIAWIDPLSGTMASAGQNQLRSFQYLAEYFSRTGPAGVKFEIVPFDNKLSPAETLVGLRRAIDQGIHYVTQGGGSGAAAALIGAIDRNNQRNPGHEVVYLNYAAVDPDLTNGQCSYWHFRVDADTSMKMEALTTWIRDRKDIHKVYLIGQDYAHGQQVRRFARADLARKRPDIEIVGDDLHPLAKITDFAPYVSKIKASGADTVITGNWGSDLTLLVKAANEAGLNVRFLTYYANNPGTPTALGPAAAGRVFFVGYGTSNMGGVIRKLEDDYQARFHDDLYVTDIYSALQVLGEAMAKAKSTDPVQVAAALEGLRTMSYNGEVEMRRADHQLQQPMHVSVWQKADARNPYSVEGTGYTFASVATYDAYVSSTPTSCQMRRP
jgi:branched-chain amino acid transport system substrate-binding protein